ncbi:hypothetical protein DICPUDRAFT_53304, partial [Dictyostelium purpureum]
MEKDYNLVCTPQQLNSINNYSKINSLIQLSYENNERKINKKESFKILDVGCSIGLNSIHQVNSIMGELKKHEADKIVEVYHSDLPINNFSLLFKEIYCNPNSYTKNFNNTYSYAIGKPYEQQLMPNNSCDIIFSYNCFHWADPNNPVFSQINKDLIIVSKPTSCPPGFDEYGTTLLTKTFQTRYNELKIGGVLSCNFSTYDHNNPVSEGIEMVFKKIKKIYREMADEKILSHKEVDAMFGQIILYKNEQVDFAIKHAESIGLKLINKEQVLIQWSKTNKD